MRLLLLMTMLLCYSNGSLSAAEPVHFEYKLPTGEEVHYRLKFLLKMNAQQGGFVPPVEMTNLDVRHVQLKVEEQDEGDSIVAIQFGEPVETKSEQTINGQPAPQFTLPDEKEAPPGELKPIRIRITPTGLPSSVPKAKEENSEEPLDSPPRPANMKELAQSAVIWMFPGYPESPVVKGETWTQDFPTPGSSEGEAGEVEPWKIITTCHGEVEKNGRSLHRLTQKLQGNPITTSKPGDAPSSQTSKITESEGEVFVDPDTGLVVESHSKYEMTATVMQSIPQQGAPGGALTFYSTAIMKFTIDIEQIDPESQN